MIAIVGAVWEELGPLLKAHRFRRIDGPADAHAYRGFVGNVPGSQVEALVLLAGMGRERSEEATAWLVRNFSLDAILAVGFAGATRDSLATGVLVLATKPNIHFIVPIHRKVMRNRNTTSRTEWKRFVLSRVLHDMQWHLKRINIRGNRQQSNRLSSYLPRHRKVPFKM